MFEDGYPKIIFVMRLAPIFIILVAIQLSACLFGSFHHFGVRSIRLLLIDVLLRTVKHVSSVWNY